MKKLNYVTLCVAALFILAGVASAGTWSFMDNPDPETDMAVQGTLLQAGNIGLNANPVTVGGISYEANPANATGSGADYTDLGYYTGAASIANLLNNGKWTKRGADWPRHVGFTFSDLVIGGDYSFQALVGYPADYQSGDHYRAYGGEWTDYEWYDYPGEIVVKATYEWNANSDFVDIRIGANEHQDPGLYLLGFTLVEVPYNIASAVYPLNGAEYIPTTAVLEWSPPVGFDPNGYDVYLSTTDPNANLPRDKVLSYTDQTTYDPDPDLAYSTLYYWRVDSYDPNGVILQPGRAWSFTTWPVEPTFTTDAEHTLVAEGDSAEFSVISPNADPCDFQWWKDGTPDTQVNDGDDGGDVSVVTDATSSTLTIANVNKTADEAFYYCVATNTYGGTESSHVKLEAEALLAHWKLDSPLVSDQYVDETGDHDADPCKPSEVSFTTGIIDDAVEMNIFRFANAGNWRPNEYNGQITVSAWVKVPNPTCDIDGDGQGIVSKRVGDSEDDFEWALYVRNGDSGHPGDNYVRFTSRNGGDVWAGPDAVDPDSPDWVYVVATVDGTGAGRLYVNGVVQAVDSTWVFGPKEDADILIGKGTPEQDDDVFPGLIDDVKIRNYAQDAYEIAADYTDVAGGVICAEDIDGDYNGDCEVDLADIAELALIWRNCNIIPASDCP